MNSEQFEEYREATCEIGEQDGTAKTFSIARCLNMAPSSVTKTLQNLSEKGGVNYEPYRVASLTEREKEMALKVKRRRQLLPFLL